MTELLQELRENCQCFQRPAFADPPCAICRAIDLIERQGKALRAVESLESFGATVELTTLLGTREMVTGAEVEVVSAAQLRAALAQTGPQT